MTSNHQTTNLVFPNFFPKFSSLLKVEKENKLFVGPKLRKKNLFLTNNKAIEELECIKNTKTIIVYLQYISAINFSTSNFKQCSVYNNLLGYIRSINTYLCDNLCLVWNFLNFLNSVLEELFVILQYILTINFSTQNFKQSTIYNKVAYMHMLLG